MREGFRYRSRRVRALLSTEVGTRAAERHIGSRQPRQKVSKPQPSLLRRTLHSVRQPDTLDAGQAAAPPVRG